MKAVIYARYSSDRQTEQSIEGQLRECEKYAREHDITIVRTYIDRALTGTNDRRDEFQRMIKDSASKAFEAVLVYKMDRFSRNRYDSAMYKAKLKANGVRVIYAAEHIPEGPEGIILESMLEGMAEYYSAELSQKIRRGMRENAFKAKSLGGRPPLGLKLSEDKRFIVDHNTAHIVKKAFELYADGYTITQINRELNALGYQSSTGAKFNKNSLWTMLRNEKYIGTYRAGDIVAEGVIEPIIENELFQRIQEMLAMNKRSGAAKKAKVNYLLSGKLYCGHCKAAMVGESGAGKLKKVYNYYKCATKKREKACDKETVSKEWLEDLVVKGTIDHILQPGKVEQIAKACAELSLAEHDNSTAINQLKKDIKKTETSIKNIMTAIEQGIFTSTTKDRLQELEEIRQNLQFELSEAEIERPIITEKHILYLLSQFIPRGDEEQEEYNDKIISSFVHSVYLYDNKAVILYNIADQDKEKSELEQSIIEPLFDDGNDGNRKSSDSVSDGGGFGIVSELKNLFYISGYLIAVLAA